MWDAFGYRRRAVLHRSAHTLVARALDPQGNHVLVKRPRRTDRAEERARFAYEFELFSKLADDEVLPAHRLLKSAEGPFMVCADPGGEPLAERLHRGAVDTETFFRIALGLVEHVTRIHRAGLIHKDINSHNVLVSSDLSSVQLLTFSIATDLGREHTKFNDSKLDCTIQYASPEQTRRMNRDIDYRTDFYSLGVVFYEMLAGRLPFDSEDLSSIIYSHIAIDPPPLEPHGVPRVLSRLVLKLLAKNAEDRYQSGHGLRSDLEEAQRRMGGAEESSEFVLGRDDHPHELRIPQKLYGRSSQIEELLAAFSRAEKGSLEFMLVAGYSGIGKSALIREVYKPLARRGGYFIGGKFEQYKRNIPYFAFAQALRGLTRQLLTEEPEALERWRTKIQGALGSAAQMVIDIIPELEHIIGEQPPVPPLPPSELEARFNSVFSSLVRVLADGEHPLAIFFDDLQWADSASLSLLRFLATNSTDVPLFLIGAYRDNEVSESHPLTLVLDEIRKSGTTVQTVTLAPLGREDITQLLSETLRCSTEDAVPLVELVERKTGGNPFFLTQFLHLLGDDGLVVYDSARQRWAWDIEQIAAKESTENVIDLMIQRLKRMEPKVREALPMAACAGSEFELLTLTEVSEAPPTEMASAMWSAAQAGMVIPLGGSYKPATRLVSTEEAAAEQTADPVYFKFLHDRVQQAAYALLPDAERARIHLRLGRSILKQASEAGELEDRVFEVVSHLNGCIALLDDSKERRRLVELNLLAGRKALDSTAYQGAQEYLEVATSLLPEDAWSEDNELTAKVYRYKAESDYLVGDFEAAAEGFDTAIRNAGSQTEKTELWTLRAILDRHVGRYDDAVDTHIAALRELGIEMPDYRTNAEAFEEIISSRSAVIRELLGDRDVDSLVELPELTDPELLSRTVLLEDVIMVGYYWGRVGPHFGALQIMDTTLRHGNCPAAALAYTIYGLLCRDLGEVRRGYRFGQMAFALAERHGYTGSKAKVGFYLGFTLNHWGAHVSQNVEVAKASYLASLESGHLAYAGMCMFCLCINMWFQDSNVQDCIDAFERYMDSMDPQGRAAAESYHDVLLRIAGDQEVRKKRSQAHEDQEAFLEDWPLALQHYYTVEVQYCFHLREYRKGLEIHQRADAHGAVQDILVGQYCPTERFFYVGMCRAGAHDELEDESERAENLAEIEKLRDVFAGYAVDCPDNFAMKSELLSAEMARIGGDVLKAMEHYDEAVGLARKYRFPRLEAVCAERAGLFFLQQGRKTVAQGYLLRACTLYARMGAKLFVDRLTALHYDVLGDDWEVGAKGGRIGTSGAVGELPLDSVDIETVYKVSQAISQEIVLSRFLGKLMRLVMENAGAQRGVFFVQRDGRLAVAAIADGDDVAVNDRDGGANLEALVPNTVIQYVERTGDAVVLDDAKSSELFRADPYLQVRPIKSLLCLQTGNKENRRGILYLENNLTTNAFPPKRVHLLQMLTSQAEISLENAVLYDTLEQKVEARTQDLRSKNEELEATLRDLEETRDRMLLQQRMASLGSLTAGIAHELKNPLNFIINFAGTSVEMVDELKEEVEELREVGADAVDSIVEVAGDVQNNLRLVDKHGRRADGIIGSMLQHSSSTASAHEPCELNKLTEHYSQLAYQGLRTQEKGAELELVTDFDSTIGEIVISEREMSRVLINLIRNAAHAAIKHSQTAKSGFVPQVRITTRDNGDAIEIRVHDNGAGVPDDVKDKLFEPFFTTKPPGEGTGLGLSISYDIVVQSHRGELFFESEPGTGTEFVVRLPKQSSSS